jgi:hypothetical protein
MAVDLRRTYFNAVLGGTGGLIGWAVSPAVRAGVSSGRVYLLSAALGAVIGASVGWFLGVAEGLLEAPSPGRVLRGGAVGAILGAVGGSLGALIGQGFFELLGGGVWPRALGWAVFGAVVGTADGMARRMPARIRFGAIGGLIGGLFGGGTYEGLRTRLASEGEAWGTALGLVLLGAMIGAMIGLVESLLRVSWVRFLNGRFEGQSRTLDPARAVTTLGASDACNIILRGDRGVSEVHAEIVVQNGDFVLRSRNGPVAVERGGPVPAAAAYVLRPGDRLVLGATRLLFHTEERKKP